MGSGLPYAISRPGGSYRLQFQDMDPSHQALAGEKSALLQNPGQGGSLPFYRYHFIQDIMESVYGIWMD